MTMINMFRRPDSVTTQTDTALYDLDGIVRSFGSKIATLPHLRAAIATRGSGLATAIFGSSLGAKFTSFDNLVAYGAGFANDVHAANIRLIAASGEVEINLALAGWSESRKRAESYYLVSGEDMGAEPWIFHEADPVFVAPLIDDDDLALVGLDPEMDFSMFDAAIHGPKIFAAQRMKKLPTLSSGEGEKFHLVGGSIVETIVTEAGIHQRVVHRWNDQINHPIRPEIPKPPAAINRHQQRAMARSA